jgi:hypothetical protein
LRAFAFRAFAFGPPGRSPGRGAGAGIADVLVRAVGSTHTRTVIARMAPVIAASTRLPASAAGISAEAPDGCQIQPWWGVSGGAAVLSGLEKRLTATTEALMMAAGEPAGVGRA